jgi:hypothetical protein
VRRPAKTRAQRQHDREQRALLRLRRAAVRYSFADEDPDGESEMPLLFADLIGAGDAYRLAIGERAARKLAR